LLLAQMPDPQPGWCQQYDERMQPCWGRKYEPPAISARETQNSCLFLLDMYDRTGNRKYVRAAQDAVPWLKQSLRPDGKFAVFYELRTNSKLYITSNYQLAYDDSDWLRTYGRVVPSVVDAIEALLAEIAAGP
jgi:PelA/Pel-15E family pectate lyase